MIYFFIVILNVVFAFGIALQAIMNPNTTFSFLIIFKIFDISYWPVFGQIDVLEKIRDCTSDDNCEELAPMIFSYVLLMVYLVFSSVLLINLLIAMFRYGA